MLLKSLKNIITRVQINLWWFYSRDLNNPFIYGLVRDVAVIINVKPFSKIKINHMLHAANAAVIGFRCSTLVLTDMLIKVLTVDELKAVILHEYAHCKLKHQVKLLSVSLVLLLGLALAIIFIIQNLGNEFLSIITSVFLLATAYILIFIITRFIARRFELEADCLAVSKLSNSYTYVELLKKLRAINGDISGLRALFTAHPPIGLRLYNILKCVERDMR